MKNFFILPIIILSLISCSKKTSEEKSISRIICLSPSTCEIVCALDSSDLIVARTDFCTKPEKVLSIPSVGGFDGKTISVEKLISFKPDFIYGSLGMHDFLVEPMRQFGIKIYLSESSSIKNIEDEILYIGSILNKQKIAEEIVKKIELDLSSVNKANNEKVYYEVWNQPYMSAGSKSYINDLLISAGFKNIFSDINENYPMISEEAIILRNPQIIFVPSQNGVSVEQIKKRPGWNSIDAVKNNKVYLIDGDIVSRPGPEINLAVKELLSLYTK